MEKLIDILKIIPIPSLLSQAIGIALGVLIFVKIIFQIDDVISKKLQMKSYIKIPLAHALDQIRESMKLPDGARAMHLSVKMKKFLYYGESSVWFSMSAFMGLYAVVIFLLLILNVNHMPIYKFFLALVAEIVFLGGARFFYVEGRKVLIKANNLQTN